MAYSEALVQQIWEKGRGMPEQDTTEWRRDECGAWIHREQYGNADSEYGWKIENVTAGGANVLENLQPFHCNNSFDVANGAAHCQVTADRTDMAPTAFTGPPRNKGL